MAKKPKKPAIGRPPKAPGDSKNRYLQVRLQDAERDGFAAAAEIRGLDVSAWVRMILREAAKKTLQENGESVPFLERK